MSETHSKCFICGEEKVQRNIFDKFLSLSICGKCRKDINDKMQKEIHSLNMNGNTVRHICGEKER